jgi:hypothetical protein
LAYRPPSFIGLPFAVIAIVVLVVIIMAEMGYFPEGIF